MPFICAFGQFSPLGFTSAEEKGKNQVPRPAGHIPDAAQDTTVHLWHMDIRAPACPGAWHRYSLGSS